MENQICWILLLSSMTIALSTFFVRRFFLSKVLLNKSSKRMVASGEGYKMVLLVRTDIGMSKGKAAAQCAHAAIASFRTAQERQPKVLGEWEADGQAKVALKVETEAELVELVKKARCSGIIAESIRDAGRTQIAAGTRTVAAIGPAPANLVDLITGHLKLY